MGIENNSKIDSGIVSLTADNPAGSSNLPKDLKQDFFDVKVNLIPPWRKKEIAKIRQLKLVFRIELAIFLVMLIFLAILFSFSYVLKLDLKAIFVNPSLAQNRQQYDKIVKYNEDFGRLNLQIEEITNMKNDQLYWSKLFSSLSEKAAPGIEITSLSTKDYDILLGGRADIRDNLIVYKEKLEQEECFLEVNLPLSDLVLPKDVDFQISFKIKEDCLNKK